MGFIGALKELTNITHNSDSEGYTRAIKGDLKDSAFVVYDYNNQMITLKEYGKMRYTEGYNDFAFKEAKASIVKLNTPSNTIIQVKEDELCKLRVANRLELHRVLEGEITDNGARFIKKKMFKQFELIEIHPICESSTSGDEDYTEDELREIEQNRVNDFDMHEKAAQMRDMAALNFGMSSLSVDMCIIGKMVVGGKVSGYLLVNRNGRIGWVNESEIKGYIKNHRVCKCRLSGTGITGVNGFRIRDTIVMNEDNNKSYIKAIKEQFKIPSDIRPEVL